MPSLKGNEWQYVKECIDTEWVSSAGKYVDLFELKIAEYTGSKYAVACVNGTAAIQISLKLAGVGPGDEVIVPTLTFIAPINAVTYNNALPVFMDADKYYNIDVEKVIDFIETETLFKDGFTYNKVTKRKISAIIPVHIWGNACSLDEIYKLCEERNITIVEDASESLGTFYNKGKFKGKCSGAIGKLGCLSFNGNKIITTGGGGMIITDDKTLAEKGKYLTTQAKDDPLRYVHNEIGYNFRLTNIQAALGVAQLEQLPIIIKKKTDIYKHYKSYTKKIEGLSNSKKPGYADNNYWMNILHIDSSIYGKGKEEIKKILEENSIQTRPVWMLNHLQKPYLNCQNYKIEKALELLNNSLCLPSSTNLTETEIILLLKHLE